MSKDEIKNAVEETKVKGKSKIKEFSEKHPRLTKIVVGAGIFLAGGGIGYAAAKATDAPTVWVSLDDPSISAELPEVTTTDPEVISAET